MNLCTIGITKNEECHKTSYTKKINLLNIDEMESEEREILLWRAGLNERNFLEGTICLHHKSLLGDRFTREFERSNNCCNLFCTHKNKVKSSHTVSLKMAKILKNLQIHCVPGWRMCRACFERINSLETVIDRGSTSSDSSLELDVEPKIRLVKKRSVDESLSKLGISPINTHSKSKRSRICDTKRKHSRAARTLSLSIADSIGVDKKMFVKEHQNDLDKQMLELREKLNHEHNYNKRIQILTLKPESWSIRKTSEFFQVSKNAVCVAINLKKIEGILAIPGIRSRSGLSDEVIKAVELFYDDDEFSRQMPGIKDYVSIKLNVHKQKRLLLCNLSELYAAFKNKFPEYKIGFSKFCTLRPKSCITVSSAGTHTVCVCTQHQNTILLVTAAHIKYNYKDLIDMIVCSKDNNICMMHRCENCPGKEILKEYLLNEFEECDGDQVISFNQWQTTDRSHLITRTALVSEFIILLTEQIDNLTKHSYLSKCQASYLKQRKEELQEGIVIFLLDFAENYRYVIQDEIQSYHWTVEQCSLHPVAIYYKKGESLVHKSLCIISDDLNHDTSFVYEVQCHTISFIKSNIPGTHKIEYFSDGCAGQYKNYKNFINMCCHKKDFDMDVEWNFLQQVMGSQPVMELEEQLKGL